jgi:Zn-finger nucleic acid-binding protein
MLTCPKDQTELTHIDIEGLPVDQCPTCGGYWLIRGELETLAGHHKVTLDPVVVGEVATTASENKCPTDGTPMRQHEFGDHSSIKIDQCPTCQGVWLDSDELNGIMQYIHQHEHSEPTLTQRVMLFLYALTKNPPYV